MHARASTPFASLAAALLVLALLASACAPATTGRSDAPTERRITMAAVEPKGGTLVNQEAFPKGQLPAGGGYILKDPDSTGRWEVSTYRWDPGTVIVKQGDRVTLEIVGINGKEHPFRIQGYDLDGVVQRGQVTTINFTADKAGIYSISCGVHQPSMNASLVVLASS